MHVLQYLDLPQAVLDGEPLYHKHTLHGRFGHTMQESIYWARHLDDRCYEGFRCGLSMTHELFLSPQPATTAQTLSVVAELVAAVQETGIPNAKSYLEGVLAILLATLSYACSSTMGPTHPLPRLFRTLHDDRERCLELLLGAMKVMLDQFRSSEWHVDWKTLYITERYGDCLYHANVINERHELRA